MYFIGAWLLWLRFTDISNFLELCSVFFSAAKTEGPLDSFQVAGQALLMETALKQDWRREAATSEVI